MLGFEALRDGRVDHRPEPDDDTRAYRRPEALVAPGIALAPLVTAMMDVSDGLLLDASRMAQARHGDARDRPRRRPHLPPPRIAATRRCAGGDDYQLLFTAPPATQLPVAAIPIGAVRAAGPHPVLLDETAPADAPLGYEHR